MKIINRIMISSAILVTLSLVVLIIFAIVGLYIAFLLSPEVNKETFDTNLYQAQKVLDNFEILENDWVELNDELSVYKYRLIVLENGDVLFSALLASEDKVLGGIKEVSLSDNILAGKIESLTFAAVQSGNYSIFAVKDPSANQNAPDGFDFDILKPILIISIIIIAVILFLSQFFTKKMSWRILRPLAALAEGAKRIEMGDLSQHVIYSGDDEFAPVCFAFNHMQDALAKEKEKTASYEKSRTDLIAGISHDLRTPLTSVKGYIKGLIDGVADTTKKREQYLKIAYSKACNMDTLLNELFFFSRLETGNFPLNLSHHDLGDFIRSFADDVKDELKTKGVVLNIKVTGTQHLVNIDTEQIRRVLVNLIDNAIKYAQVDEIVLQISLISNIGAEYLIFADNGQGVTKEQLPHLFEQFWRGDEARSSKNSEGSGLGLYIVKHIVESHGGSISAENDNGLKIKISLPTQKLERTANE